MYFIVSICYEKNKFFICFLSNNWNFSCKGQSDSEQEKTNSEPPKVNFDSIEIPKNYKVTEPTLVNDLEKIFSEEERNNLEKYLVALKESEGKKILILTVPSNMKNNINWKEGVSYSNSGIIINISKSLKEVSIGIAGDTIEIFSKEYRSNIVNSVLIPEFEKGNYYKGVKKVIEDIINVWE